MQIRQITGDLLELQLSTDEEKAHFENPFNYTKEILAEWDSQPFKDLVTQKDKVIIDCGANVGLFAIHVLPYVQKIVCVEPTPGHMAIQKTLLKSAASMMFLQTKIIHEEAALNSYTGKAKFRTEPINTTMNTLVDRPDSYEVDCITLADLCAKHQLTKVDLVKVDIEGSETQAITVETVADVSSIVNKFLLETHPRTREVQDYFIGIFKEAGYQAEYVDFNGSVIAYK